MSDTPLRRALVQQLESFERAGINELPRPTRIAVAAPASVEVQRGRGASSGPVARQNGEEPDGARAASPAAATRRAPAASLFAANAWEGAPKLPPDQRAGALNLICGQVKGCQRCQELAGTRTQTVFGVGNPSARLCFMGEAPGADEDAQGEPFVGRAGQLLNKIIEACTLRRSDVYILNTLKCRPPGNRNPLPSEVTNCREFLDRQLDIIQPEFICCLGSVAAQALLATDSSIGKLRKRFFDYRGCRVLCTYHPAYLLRNPAAKKDVWDDMQLLMAEMGIPLPAKSGK
ncbi:MAG TPA: uracil-DNA glycosylase [Pirellulales bacterium]|nr:uracil-DNA glycosylase [Pirellulales bacterium]